MQTSNEKVDNLQRDLKRYAEVSLSSFDNLKLVFALVSSSSATNKIQEQEERPLAYEASPFGPSEQTQSNLDETNELNQPIYCIKWLGHWIHCGNTASYAAKVQVLDASEQSTEIDRIEKSRLREIDVPVLTLQQIEFICMDHAHFDHC
ncbi:hypothetical protein [Shewanella sp. UCD-KL12]|uniref:hypothetical protein n=1 Tax=Shewanella sp. UCD-KL12 TaxID=1917163 RepID=UPI000970F125|nr:hypothetical protein [Shewanella sp. UCD-KL12]